MPKRRRFKVDITCDELFPYGVFLRRWWGWSLIYHAHNPNDAMQHMKAMADLPRTATGYER